MTLPGLAGYSAQLYKTTYASAYRQNVPDMSNGNLHTSYPGDTSAITTCGVSTGSALVPFSIRTYQLFL